MGIGAVLGKTDSQGREHPIHFASRTLTQAERNFVIKKNIVRLSFLTIADPTFNLCFFKHELPPYVL
jgi:hypothetical protein